MKKLYFLNEEEKQRILKLHKSKQIGKFWLNEQDELPVAKTVGDPNTYAVTTPFPKGTWSQVAKDEFMSYIDSYTTSEYAGYAIRPTVAKIKNFCETQVDQMGDPDQTPNKILLNAKNFEAFMKANSRSGVGVYQRGVTDASGFVQLIKQLTNIPNVCYSIRNHKTLRGSETIADIWDEVYWDSNFQKYVLETLRTLALQTKVSKPLKTKVKTGVDGEESTDDGSIGKEWDKYSCLTDIAIPTKSKKALLVQNPSEHNQIIDQSQGKKTDIVDKTTFMSDGTYITYADAKTNAISGKYQCSRDFELILLYPGQIGMGTDGGIYAKFPCLGKARKDGTAYTTLEDNQAVMSDDDRRRHPIFSGYPEGDIYFSIDGTFQTENDFNNDVDVSGKFKCKSQGRISAPPFKGVSTEPIKPVPVVTTTGGGGSRNVGGMGIVSASSSSISEILKCAKIGGSTLDQNALNQLYDYIKNNK
jgi:hypothetical protein